MLGWRLTNYPSLDGVGGTLAPGRWHTMGRRIVYLARCASTSLLEILVRADVDRDNLPVHYQLLTVDIPDDVTTRTVGEEDLPPTWRDDASITRRIGDAWLATQGSAILQVPCAIVPEVNILLNPKHAEAARVSVVRASPYRIDTRLT